MNQALQIRIELMGTEPSIWRRIQIGAGCTFWDLHVAIQDAMGWRDSHLHLFAVDDPAGGKRRLIGLPLDDDGLGVEPGWDHKVTELLSPEHPRALYEYDFGDSWEHDVVLEDVLPVDAPGGYPRCVGGERACPPEDVGGVPGYADFLEVITDPEHAEHEGYIEWVGGAFDPERFDPGSVRFQDPEVRRQEVLGEAVLAAGLRLPGGPQLEGGFTGEEIQRLLLSPLSERSPLELRTDLPDAELEAAPLLREFRGFLEVLAEEAPLKLTQKGNLPRATLARMIAAGIMGPEEWWEGRRTPNEQDVPGATILRLLAEGTGMTRKRHGKLDLTQRGRAAVEERTPAGEIYRRLLEHYVAKVNWGYADIMPDSWWLQAGFWYFLYLVQEHGGQKRPATFYSERYARAFPSALQDFAGTPLMPAAETLGWAFERRVLGAFAVEFGLAQTETVPEGLTEPLQVWAGPLLHQVVRWGRAGRDAGEDDDAARVVAGSWTGEGAGENGAGETADPTIAEALGAFLAAQRRRLRSPGTIRKYEQVVELLKRHLDTCGTRCGVRHDGHPRSVSETYHARHIPQWVDGFLDEVNADEVTAPPQVVKAAGTVCKKLLAWLQEEGLADADGAAAPEN